jgi:lipoyl-dependent peroxiredoxin subunit D
MNALNALRERFPDAARDIKINLESVLGPSSLTDAQKWGVAYATAIASRHVALRDAVKADASAVVGADVLEDARAAAVLMAMNNVFYRSRHMLGNPDYETKPARLRMQRLGKPATNKVDFELMSLAVSAVNGCETCLQSHEKVVREGGLSDDAVFDAIRIAGVIHAAACALEITDA